MNRARVSSVTCRSRAPDVAIQAAPSKSCTRTYSHTAKNTATDVHIRAGSRTRTHAYVRPGLVYMERGNGRQQRPPVHRQPTGWVGTAETASGAKRLGRNASCSSGSNLLGRNSRNGVLFSDSGSGVPQNGGNGLLFDRLRSKWGPVHRLGVWRTAKRRKRTSVQPPTVKMGCC
jgi:hypothetical protein